MKLSIVFLFPERIQRFAYTAFWLAIIGLSMSSCSEKEIEAPTYPALSPHSIDASGGSWKQVILSGPSQIEVVAPVATLSDQYQQELAEVKSLQGKLTSEQKKAVEYWASGSTLRWNEIARELVVKYNRAPDVNAPFDPTNPFANPPVAARVYALLSVAQYDALVSAWHYKYLYNRPAPNKVDNAVKRLVPASNLPAYPSEDAVVAAASEAVLKFLFPKEEAYLQELAQQNKQARLWAGANVASDIISGNELGRAVAQKVMDYAKKDRMSSARDADNTWQQINVPINWVKWECLEKPLRAPMLPLYGKVKTWFDSTAVMATLPPPPPAVGSKEFQDALAEVRRYADKRTREQWRIADFWADGAGTFTPPGHWNKIAADLIRENQLNELRTARTFALMNRAIMDGGIICWYAKYQFFLPRPSQFDNKIKTATGIPNFPSYTSGHSTFSMAAATVLGYVFPEEAAQLKAQAEEAGMSRIYGGIHFNFDNIAGQNSGRGVGQLAIQWAMNDGAPQ